MISEPTFAWGCMVITFVLALGPLNTRGKPKVIIGNQDTGTRGRGRSLVDGAETVAVHRYTTWIRARLFQLQALPTNAPRDEFLRRYREPLGQPKRSFLSYGEAPTRKVLRVAISEEPGWNFSYLPLTGESVPW